MNKYAIKTLAIIFIFSCLVSTGCPAQSKDGVSGNFVSFLISDANSIDKNLNSALNWAETKVQKLKAVTVSYRNDNSGGGSFGWLGIVLLIFLIRFTKSEE